MKYLLSFLTLIFSFNLQAQELQVDSWPLAQGTIPRNAVALPMLKIQVKALKDTQIQSLEIKRTGLSSSEDIGRVWAQTSNYRRSTKRQFTNKDTVALDFKTPIALKKGEQESITVYANLNFNTGGRTLTFQLQSLNSHEIETSKTLTPKPKKLQHPPHKFYNRSQYKISCRKGKCQLVKRS